MVVSLWASAKLTVGSGHRPVFAEVHISLARNVLRSIQLPGSTAPMPASWSPMDPVH